MKILAVCGFGVGSSMVLKMTIDKVVKELGIKADVENTDLSSAKATRCDLVFTSTELMSELKNSMSVPVYPVKNYMSAAEVRGHLEDYLEKAGN